MGSIEQSRFHKQPFWANAALVLETGIVFWGRGTGAQQHAIGELCFNTAQTGYQEIITDPSYAEQIIVFTSPHIGNVGVNHLDQEHPRPACKGLVFREPPTLPANYRGENSLQDWMIDQGLTGIYGIDTRALTAELREGALRASIIYQESGEIDLKACVSSCRQWPGLNGAELSLSVSNEKGGPFVETESGAQVRAWLKDSWRAPESHRERINQTSQEEGQGPLVVVIDFGVKDQILRCLVDLGCRVEVMSAPCVTSDVIARRPDAVCLSNGPGDPAATYERYAGALIKGLLEYHNLPIFGICLGHQMLALALGARTEKMKRGHRGANHPILNLESGLVEITSQNHGFVVTDLPVGVLETHRSLFDGTIAGLRLENRPVFSVQYHPEASPGPHDSRYLFERFVSYARGDAEGVDLFDKSKNAEKERQSKALKPRKIMIVGAGPIVIGQACEFDYSGAQACKSLRAAGHEVVLVNSNPATIMTDPSLANRTYIEPLTVAYLEEIIRIERPDALLPTMGGQTALNVCLELSAAGVLERYQVEMIGARREAIETAEDRQLFREAMDEVGLASPRSHLVHTLEQALEAVQFTSYPSIIRPSFTLGGSGGGIATNETELREIVTQGLTLSPVSSVLIEESLLGWKEYELEVVRDRSDNGIIVCSIENIDPMGIHTGDSITVAPALTLTDKEYQRLRDQALTCLRRVGVDTGGSNVQFAINPKDGRAVVIEMNPRVSRSSALASKATGFPIAKIAAQLAVGHTLDELTNEITRVTPASFEPSIDYIVVKIPRFTFEKFSSDLPRLNTSMKSVGEVMAIGRSFAESLQKALRGLEVGYCGLNEQALPEQAAERLKFLEERIPYRILFVAQALREGHHVEELSEMTGIDPWYVRQLEELIRAEQSLKSQNLESIDAYELHLLKRQGFSDLRIATLLSSDAERVITEDEVRARRWELGVHPIYRRVDTCAAEFESFTQYLYSSYELSTDAIGDVHRGGLEAETTRCEARPSKRKKVMILGGGPNRIGQGIEFDYCCVHAAYAIKEAGYEAIMVNCNPETVSTDYDTADRLYFEPLTAEDVIEIARVEASRGELLGVIVQLGGQTPLNLAESLERAGIPILGTPRDVIDRAEDRARFQALVEKLELKQPPSAVASDVEDAVQIANRVGYPVLLRPSYVLGGRAMRLVHDEAELRRYMNEAQEATVSGGVLVDKYLMGAIEVDVDAISDGEEAWIVGVMEHIEEAGVHSGDSACALPPHSLSPERVNEIKRQAQSLALELGVVGLMNVQFAVSNGEIYLIEVNPRASRTVPFVAKALDLPVAHLATQIMLGQRLSELDLPSPREGFFAVKEAVFPFARFPNADLLLGPEMLSTGEVMGWDRDFYTAYAKAQLAAGMELPSSGALLFTIGDPKQRAEFEPLALEAIALGYQVYVGVDSAEQWSEESKSLLSGLVSLAEATKLIKSDAIQLLISVEGDRDAMMLRRAGLEVGLPYFTRLSNTRAMIGALGVISRQDAPSVNLLQREPDHERA